MSISTPNIVLPPVKKGQVLFILESPDSHSSQVFVEQISKVRSALLDPRLSSKIHLFECCRDRINQVTPIPDWAKDYPCVVYGSLQFNRDIKEPIFPGSYGIANTDWLSMAANYPRDGLFNSDYTLGVWADIYDNFGYYSSLMLSRHSYGYGARKPGLFIRPASSKKVFSGQVVKNTKDMDALKDISSAMDDTLCVVANPKSVGSEYRFFIVDNKVVAETVYSYNHTALWLPTSVDAGARKLADHIAMLKWQPDSCYCVDITYGSNSEAQVVELNSFSSAGVYNADAVALLSAVVDQALRDFGP